MKTWEMIKELNENPDKEFVSDQGDISNEMVARMVGDLLLFDYTYSDNKVEGINIRTRKWEEVKKSMNFIELLEITKKGAVLISFNNRVHGISYQDYFLNDILADLTNEFSSNVIAEILLEGEFYVER